MSPSTACAAAGGTERADRADVVVNTVVRADDQFVLELALTGKQPVVAQAVHRALPGKFEWAGGSLERTGINVGVTGKHVNGVAEPVERQAVAEAVDLHLVLLFGRRDVLHSGNMVAIEQVGVLQTRAESCTTSLIGAGIVQRGKDAPGFFVLHLNLGVDLVFLFGWTQDYACLLDRTFVGHPQIVRQRARTRRLPFLQRGQAAVDIGRAEIFVARNFHLADTRLDHAQDDNAALECLLGKIDLDGAETGLPISAFERLQCALHVGKIALLALERGEHGFDLLFLEEGVAFDVIGGNVKAKRYRIGTDRLRQRKQTYAPDEYSRGYAALHTRLPFGACTTYERPVPLFYSPGMGAVTVA